MIFLGEMQKIDSAKYSVSLIHSQPFDAKNGLGKTQEQLEQEGILVEGIPELIQTDGKQAMLYYNPATKELWYEYDDIPKTEEELLKEQVVELQAQNAQMLLALVEGGLI